MKGSERERERIGSEAIRLIGNIGGNTNADSAALNEKYQANTRKSNKTYKKV